MKRRTQAGTIASLMTAVFLFAAPSSAFAQEEGQAQSADAFIEKTQSAPQTTPSITGTQQEQNAEKSKYQVMVEETLEKAAAENENEETLEEKVALAQQMHDIRPTREQVDAAVQRAAMGIPQNEREGFINAMTSILNYNAIERISIDAMVETYTLAELEAMTEYYSKPEAMTASLKLQNWAQKVQPEIIRMIDKAMIRIRTGQ